MRNSLRCPKCDGQAILRVAAMKELGHANQPHEINVAMQAHVLGYAAGLGRFETYICKGCGYTEWYATGIESLGTDEALGTELLDGRAEKIGPYR